MTLSIWSIWRRIKAQGRIDLVGGTSLLTRSTWPAWGVEKADLAARHGAGGVLKTRATPGQRNLVWRPSLRTALELQCRVRRRTGEARADYEKGSPGPSA